MSDEDVLGTEEEVSPLDLEDALPEESGFAPVEAAEKEEPNRVFFF